jgi:hypothetical protein
MNSLEPEVTEIELRISRHDHSLNRPRVFIPIAIAIGAELAGLDCGAMVSVRTRDSSSPLVRISSGALSRMQSLIAANDNIAASDRKMQA